MCKDLLDWALDGDESIWGVSVLSHCGIVRLHVGKPFCNTWLQWARMRLMEINRVYSKSWTRCALSNREGLMMWVYLCG